MLKVECEACKAPYQVDERRVPPTGLKMRCPKCGHAFTVSNPDAKPVAPPVSKHTIMGVSAVAPPAPAAPAAASRAPAAPIGELPMDEDLLPQLPAAKAKPPKPPPPRPAPLPAAPLGEIDELMDLPAMPAPLPAVVKPLAPVKPTLMSPQSGPVKPKAAPSLADYEIDLPSASADLPAARGPGKPPPPKKAPAADLPAAKPAPTVGGALFEVDLPSPAAGSQDLPAAKGGAKPKKPNTFADLPATRQDADLPAAFGDVGLPAPFGDIGLPAPFGDVGLPSPAGGGFGSIDLPAIGESLPMPVHGAGLPAAVDQGNYLPRAAGAGAHLPTAAGAGAHLPTAAGAGAHLPTAVGHDMHLPASLDALPSAVGDHQYLPSGPAASGSAFGEADFGDVGGGAPAPAAVAQAVPGGQGGVGFGELDFGSSGGESVGVDEAASGGPASFRQSGNEAALPGDQALPRARDRVVISKDQGRLQKVVVIGLVAAAIAGAAMELTSYGAFGRLAISDFMHSGEWTTTAATDMGKARAIIREDLYDHSRAAADAIATQSTPLPRALALTAAAALTEYEFETRFGRDAARATRADGWVKSIAKAKGDAASVAFYSAAAAGRAAAQGDLASARALLETAAQKDPGGPVQEDIAFLRGEIELTAKDEAAATKAFTRALQVAPSARAHYGLARSHALGPEHDKARSEIALTLAATPNHPGALVLKAWLDWQDDRNDTTVIDGLKPLIEGVAKVSASPAELSRAFTLFGLAETGRGDMGAARTAFEAALKYDSTNADALLGQGEVFYADGRFTEALSRFDTAVQSDPKNPAAIVAAAKAKISLERLAEAKAQLVAAQQVVPKNLLLTYWLGRAEEKLGNKKGAEEAYEAAIVATGPKDRDAIQPYVALSTLLASEGRATEAQAKLNEGRAKLPDSAEMQRALGDVASAEGLFDEALGHYKAAADKDSNDIRSRFELGRTYLKMRRLDEASAEFDKVAAADKNYPNLALERGELLEQSGHQDQALLQFKAALERAPKDLDLQLRVGAAYVGIGRGEEGYNILKPVYDQRQNSAEVNHYLGRALLLEGGQAHLVDALRYLQRAVDVEPTRAEYHLYLAWAATESKDWKLGQTEVDSALRIDQLLGDAYWQRGVIEEVQGAVDDAIRDCDKALALHPSRTDAHATLAKAYADKNQNAKALAEWATATSRSSDHPEWEFLYGRMLFDGGSVKEALPHVLIAAKSAEAATPSPIWMARAEFMAAEALLKTGNKVDAKEHFHRYLDKAELSAPDRAEARTALKKLDPDFNQ
jgi:predicted Zn finger-like uncharacterized protein